MQAIKRRVRQWVLSGLSTWVKGVDESQPSSGDDSSAFLSLSLHNLQLKPDCLDGYDVPISVVGGQIATVNINVN